MADEDIPQDLIDLQRRWYEAEAAWCAAPDDRQVYEAFVAVGMELYFHPYWSTVENRFKATVKVREAAKAAA